MASVVEIKTKDGQTKYKLKVKIRDSFNHKTINKAKIYIPSKDLSEPEAYEQALKEAELFEEQIRKDLEYGIDFKDYTIEEYSNIYLDFIKKNFAISYYLKAKYCASISSAVKPKSTKPNFKKICQACTKAAWLFSK